MLSLLILILSAKLKVADNYYVHRCEPLSPGTVEQFGLPVQTSKHLNTVHGTTAKSAVSLSEDIQVAEVLQRSTCFLWALMLTSWVAQTEHMELHIQLAICSDDFSVFSIFSTHNKQFWQENTLIVYYK